MTLRRIGRALIPPVLAAVISLIVSSIALLISSNNPIDAYDAMWNYVSTTASLVAILNRGASYYVVALGAAIGFKMGLFNIGVDGQYRLAALLAAAAGAEMNLAPVLHVALIMAVAVGVGSSYAFIPGILKVTRGVNEVIATIMLNFVATGLIALMLRKWFRDTTPGSLVTRTKRLPESAWLPPLDTPLSKIGIDLPRNSSLNGYLVIAMVVGIAYYLLVYRTRYGYDLRASGVNAAAARASGVNPRRMIVVTMMLSGGLAGLAATGPLLSETRLYDTGGVFPLRLGFTGIGIALLGRNHPAGVALGAFVYAGIERSTQVLSVIGMPSEISFILQGTLILSSVIAYEVVRRRSEAAAVRSASRGRDVGTAPEPLVGRIEGASP